MRRTLVILVSSVAVAGCDPPDISIEDPPIKITTETPGYGDPVEAGDLIKVNYTVTLPNGKEVLSDKGFRFQVGADAVIAGIDETVVGMRMGSVRTFTCPPHRHWGRKGYGGVIPPNTDLTIRLSLIDIEGRARRRIGSADGN